MVLGIETQSQNKHKKFQVWLYTKHNSCVKMF